MYCLVQCYIHVIIRTANDCVCYVGIKAECRDTCMVLPVQFSFFFRALRRVSKKFMDGFL